MVNKEVSFMSSPNKTKILIFLIILAIFDMVIPIPFTAILLIYILLKKPGWFHQMVTGIYNS
jgi:lipopolysaccharide/colanic/teichoic acid biosynthesis glycosyltransferase